MKSIGSPPKFRGNMSPPSSELKSKRRKKPVKLVSACFSPFRCFSYSSILNIEAMCSSETSVDFQGTARHEFQKLESFIATGVRTSKPTWYEMVCLWQLVFPFMYEYVTVWCMLYITILVAFRKSGLVLWFRRRKTPFSVERQGLI
jgi:hypothetical protein